jgi:hypothetical protein
MGQKVVCFGQLRPTRSRQDESKEVHEVGSKRPSSWCNGVHVLSLHPLIRRSLSLQTRHGPHECTPTYPSPEARRRRHDYLQIRLQCCSPGDLHRHGCVTTWYRRAD